MRLWPRGIRKSRVDIWLKELGPVLPLLRAFRAGEIGWAEYRRRYRRGLARPEAQAHVAAVRAYTKAGRRTPLFGCPYEAPGHPPALPSRSPDLSACTRPRASLRSSWWS